MRRWPDRATIEEGAVMTAAAPAADRIGPNAVTRLQAVLMDRVGYADTMTVFADAGLARYLARPPQDMVAEGEVRALYHRLRASYGPDLAATLAFEAGERTADYLLAHRIPRAAQHVLKRLPTGIASRALLTAVGRHAWTFAGSGRFAVLSAAPAAVRIADNPLCRGETAQRPVCDFYAGTFQRLYRTLVHPDACALETACEAMGDPACIIEIRW